ncbi:hypothetical protein HPB50_008144 [Hyalomma asiaticum]|uniref:Uncharacterized protein n=1 Tax=Hyalomma asiaticum TaxID=266040 RepID=A0ACB7SLU0_HYAAI|nr:hypothetical protein HPB50_008144 [Hyalomma asiaticum]
MALTIDKSNGGYHDVLVAIEESTEPNEAVVEAVKMLLRAASSTLHWATGGLVHLASVTLAVPRHWPPRPGVQQVPHDPWSRADIRIVNGGPGSLWNQLHAPTALHKAACGQRGEHVLLPITALPTNSSSDETIVTAGYQLAREWARYRYGALGEFVTADDVWYPEDSCNGSENATVASLKETVASVVADNLSEGSLVSLVYFVNGSSLHSGPVTVSRASRANIANRILQVSTEGPTCTHCGLQTALQVLSSTPEQSAEGSLVVLFSDGKSSGTSFSSTEEDRDGFLSVVPDFQRAKVFITTVAVGAVASASLEKVALETGGRTYAIRDTSATAAEKQSWIAAIQHEIGNGHGSGLLGARSGLCFEDSITLRVRAPEYVDTYRAALVFASLTKGLCPVVHAKVSGIAFFQDSSAGEKFLLHDSGLGEDVYASDGIYTGQFTKFRGRGRYRIAVEVSNKSQTQFLDWMTNDVAKESPVVEGEHATTSSSLAGVRGHSTGAFIETSAGHPMFVKQDINQSHVPPGKVRDLQASLDAYDGRPVARLSWTMPGAHAFEGTVSSVDIRSSRSIQTMLDFFHKATKVSEQDVLSGSVKPLPAFSRQQATISIPSTTVSGRIEDDSAGQSPPPSGRNIYFALVTANAGGYRSEISNLARVFVPANFAVPAGRERALAGAAPFVPEKISDAANDSETADASLPTEAPSIPPSEQQSPSEELTSETASAETAMKTSEETVKSVVTTTPAPITTSKTVSTTPQVDGTTGSVSTPTKVSATVPESEASVQTTPMNGSEPEQNATAPPVVEKKAVNKNEQEEEDDGTFRAWVLFGTFVVACLLICANLACLYCKAQYEVDDGPPSPGTTAMTTGFSSF